MHDGSKSTLLHVALTGDQVDKNVTIVFERGSASKRFKSPQTFDSYLNKKGFSGTLGLFSLLVTC